MCNVVTKLRCSRIAICCAAVFLCASIFADPPATRPANAIATWFGDLANRDPAVREKARSNLMGLKRDDLPALRNVPNVESWTYPGPPHVAHVKNVGFDPRNPDTIYAAVEVGGVEQATLRWSSQCWGAIALQRITGRSPLAHFVHNRWSSTAFGPGCLPSKRSTNSAKPSKYAVLTAETLRV